MCFSHIDADGNAVMVDVTEKAATHRRAVAAGSIRMNEEAFAAVRDKTARKGDVLGVAQVAGIMATKETSRLIPLCHGLGLTACNFSSTRKAARSRRSVPYSATEKREWRWRR